MKNRSNKIIMVMGVVLLAVVVVLVMASSTSSGGGAGGGHVSNSNATDVTTYSDTENTDEDMTIDEFRKLLESMTVPVGENARDAATSSNVPTVSETYESFVSRGFDDVVIYADFNLDGEYTGSQVLERQSSRKFPSYSFDYVSATGVYWTIYCNDGSIVAVPHGDSESLISKQVILCESDIITQYDGDKNEYSDFSIVDIPNASVVKISKIDRSALDSYSCASIEAM